MPTLEWTAIREGGVTLVACRLSNTGDAPRRIRVDPEPDTVWPPRRRGIPAAGWRDGRYETILPAGATVGVGFATPDPPGEPPAAVTAIDAAADPGGDAGPIVEPTAAEAVRSLLDPRPPRVAVAPGREGSPVRTVPAGGSGPQDWNVGERRTGRGGSGRP